MNPLCPPGSIDARLAEALEPIATKPQANVPLIRRRRCKRPARVPTRVTSYCPIYRGSHRMTTFVPTQKPTILA